VTAPRRPNEGSGSRPSRPVPPAAAWEREVRIRFRDWRFRVRDILEAISAIADYTDGMTYEEFLADRRTRDAVLRNLTTMGESVRWIPDEVLAHHPEVPWDTLRGVRNVVVHQYFGVDTAILWETVRGDLPPLTPRLERVLAGRD
jgi:uncharacterized protein with HEPN domain